MLYTKREVTELGSRVSKISAGLLPGRRYFALRTTLPLTPPPSPLNLPRSDARFFAFWHTAACFASRSGANLRPQHEQATRSSTAFVVLGSEMSPASSALTGASSRSVARHSEASSTFSEVSDATGVMPAAFDGFDGGRRAAVDGISLAKKLILLQPLVVTF